MASCSTDINVIFPEFVELDLVKKNLKCHLAQRLKPLLLEQFAVMILKNHSTWRTTATSQQSTLFIKRNPGTGIHRSLLYDPNLNILLVLLNRKIKGDRLLGEGSYKKVTLAFDILTGKKYASAGLKLKKDMYRPYSPKTQARVERKESSGFKYTIGMEGFTQLITTARYSTPSNPNKTRFIMTYANYGCLNDVMDSLSKSDKWNITKSLIESLTLLHHKEIIHRDIKPTNILLHKKHGSIKPIICDLGSACSARDLRKLNNDQSSSFWVSPEFASAKISLVASSLAASTTFKHDVWALGIVLYEMWTYDELPWFELSKSAVYTSICKESSCFEKHSEINPLSTQKIYRLLYKMLRASPTDRITAQEAHFFVSK